MRVKPGRQKFNTPIEVGTASNVNTNDDKSVDEEIDTYLGDRRKRLLDEAKLAELEHVAEDEKTEAARSRKERELLVGGKLSPIGKEGDMEDTEKKIEDAAEVAAEAAAAGVPPQDAKALGTGESRVAVIKPGEKTEEGKGGWSVLNGRPIRESEGEYTFSQALKVIQLEIPKTSGNEKKSLGEELAEAKAKLETLGIRVGTPTPPPPRSLSEQVTEAKELLEGLGLKVGIDKQAPLKDQVAEAKSLLEGFGLTVGIPGPVGEPLENIKETHRHEEHMGEISATRDHNERLTDLASSIPENIGRGVGEDMRRHKGGPKGSPSSTLDKIKCDECGTEFVVPPEAMEKGEATCPKCGMVYKGEK